MVRTAIVVAFLGLAIHCLYLGYALGDEPHEDQDWPSADGFAAWARTLRLTRWAWTLMLIAGLPWAVVWASTPQWIIVLVAHAGSAWLLRELGRAERVVSVSRGALWGAELGVAKSRAKWSSIVTRHH